MKLYRSKQGLQQNCMKLNQENDHKLIWLQPLICVMVRRLNFYFAIIVSISYMIYNPNYNISISDTCHFQKLSDDSKSSEFDFHWNTSPTSIVCAFPYIIAFTSDSMEIRLLVNGNLVHIVQMAELQLLTSKRDIYFTTTAPEFISKDLRLKWSENENHLNPDKSLNKINKMSELSNEKILEIKHKIEKLQETNNNNNNNNNDEFVANIISENDAQIETQQSIKNVIQTEIDTLEMLNNLKPAVSINDETPLQRVRSLQNHKDRRRDSDELKKQISKSNSYTDATQILINDKEFSANKQIHDLFVPPNSPKLQISVQDHSNSASPSKNKNRSPISRFSHDSHESASSSPDRLKPLRIYRIPLTNLTGAHHSHAHNPHAHNANSKKSTPNKIAEDSHEVMDLRLTDQATSDAASDILLLNKICDDKIPNCTNLSVISSSFS